MKINKEHLLTCNRNIEKKTKMLSSNDNDEMMLQIKSNKPLIKKVQEQSKEHIKLLENKFKSIHRNAKEVKRLIDQNNKVLCYLMISLIIFIIISFVSVVSNFFPVNSITPIIILLIISLFLALFLRFIRKNKILELFYNDKIVISVYTELQKVYQEDLGIFEKLFNSFTKKVNLKFRKKYLCSKNLTERNFIRKKQVLEYLLVHKDILSKLGFQIDLRLMGKLEKANLGKNEQDLFEEIDILLCDYYPISKQILNLFYNTYYGYNTISDYHKIIQDDDILNKLVQILFGVKQISDLINNTEHLKLVLRTSSKFDFDELIERITGFLKAESILNRFLDIINKMNLIGKRMIILKEVMLRYSKKKDDYQITEIILSELLNYISKKNEEFKGAERELLKFYILKDSIRFIRPEIFKKYVKNLDLKNFSFKLLFKCLSQFSDISELLEGYNSQKSCFAKFIRESSDIKVEHYWIKHFKLNLLEGKIITDPNILAYEHVKNIEDKYDVLEYIFVKGDLLNYKCLYTAVFNKQVTANLFLKIISLQRDITPFLITYTSGITIAVDSTLQKLGTDFPNSIEWVKYTPTARIGIFTNFFQDLHHFRLKFEEIFTFKLFKGIKSSKIKFLKDQLSRAEKEVYEDLIKQGYQEEAESLKMSLSEIRAELKIEKLPLIELSKARFIIDNYSSTGLYATNAIEEVTKTTNVFFHKLFSEEEGIEKIEIFERYSPINKIKSVFLNRIDMKSATTALSFTRDFEGPDFYQIFENFLKEASFEDLLITDDDFSEFKSLRDKVDDIKKDNKEQNFIDSVFGIQGIKSFMKSLAPIKFKDYTLYELGFHLKNLLDTKMGWSPEFFRINKEVINKNISKFKLGLIDFWKSKFDDFKLKNKRSTEEFRKLEGKIDIMSNCVLNYILYVMLVITPELRVKELAACRETYESVKTYLNEKLGPSLKQLIENDKTFQYFLIRTVQFVESLREVPISMDTRRKDYILVNENDLEEYFQNKVYSHFKKYFHGYFHREPQIQRVRFDFVIGEIPIEVKMMKKDYKKHYGDFIHENLKQISDYCTRNNAEVGCLFIYDNKLIDDVNIYDVNNIDIYDGIIDNDKREIKIPKIIAVRIPNYVISSSEKK